MVRRVFRLAVALLAELDEDKTEAAASGLEPQDARVRRSRPQGRGRQVAKNWREGEGVGWLFVEEPELV